VRAVRPGLPAVAVLPSVHRAPSYAGVHTGRAAGRRAIAGWAAARGVALVDLEAVAGEHVRSGAGNPDGIHWGWPGHELAGAAFAEAIAELLGRPSGRACAPLPH
jgi:hypothetical protein